MKQKPSSYYNEDYYSGVGGKGYKGEYTFASAPWHGMARAIVQTFGCHIGAKTCTDFGCAKGFVLWFLLNEYGWAVQGYDWSDWVCENGALGVPIECKDITKRGEFMAADVTLCTDTLEHIQEDKLETTLGNIYTATNKVFIAHIGLTETVRESLPEHVTMHDRAWWQERFEAAGFVTSIWEPLYITRLRRATKTSIGKLWAADAFVLEPVPAVEVKKIELEWVPAAMVEKEWVTEDAGLPS